MKISEFKISGQKEKTYVSNYVTNNLFECINYWNRQGADIIDKNQKGIYGNAETKKQAETMKNDDFILDGLLLDCKAYINSDFAKNSGDTYECGRTRSHVWLHINGERVLMIFAEKK